MTRDPESQALPRDEADRLLSRAAELDAAGQALATVGDLRAAAGEAGISAQAFDAALTEQGHRPRRRWAVALGVVVLLAAVLLTVFRRAPADVPTVEDAIQLQCLTAGDAAELVRPILLEGPSTVAFNRDQAPRVLTIRTTPALLQRIKTALAEADRTCALPAPGAPSR